MLLLHWSSVWSSVSCHFCWLNIGVLLSQSRTQQANTWAKCFHCLPSYKTFPKIGPASHAFIRCTTRGSYWPTSDTIFTNTSDGGPAPLQPSPTFSFQRLARSPVTASKGPAPLVHIVREASNQPDTARRAWDRHLLKTLSVWLHPCRGQRHTKVLKYMLIHVVVTKDG